jgi:predicted ATPase
MRARLSRLRIKGLRTIYDSEEIRPGPITVLIGPNGAGKSNFVSFFRMMSWMLTPPGKLGEYVQLHGPASKILSDGQDVTRDLSGEVEVTTDAGRNEYTFRLTYATGDRFVFTEERWRFTRSGSDAVPDWTELGVGHQESMLLQAAERGDTTARVMRDLLRRIVVYQFHNTSTTARVRGQWDTRDNRYLKEDGANLAPVLLRLRDERPEYYHRIVEMIRRILPFFADFEFEPQARQQILNWHEHYSDRVFDASQAADGMLRVMALCTLMLLPEDDLPNAIVLDEPELGLHPFAINILGGLIRSMATKVQIILATQSSALVDCFEPEQVLVVERSLPENGVHKRGRRTAFHRLDTVRLSEWLQEYTLSELWEKNVLGGKP